MRRRQSCVTNVAPPDRLQVPPLRGKGTDQSSTGRDGAVTLQSSSLLLVMFAAGSLRPRNSRIHV